MFARLQTIAVTGFLLSRQLKKRAGVEAMMRRVSGEVLAVVLAVVPVVIPAVGPAVVPVVEPAVVPQW